MGEMIFCNKCGSTNAQGAQFCSSCGTSMNPVAVAPAAGSGIPSTGAPAVYSPSVPYQGAAAGVGYGGFWIRFVAFIIDAIIVRVVLAPVSLLFGLGMGFGGMMGGLSHGALGLHLLGGLMFVFVLTCASWLYEAFLLSSSYQATLGKMIFGMKVTDLQGQRISFARATGRHFGKWLSGMILFIGFIMAGFTERKQALHDMLAGTLVRRS